MESETPPAFQDIVFNITLNEALPETLPELPSQDIVFNISLNEALPEPVSLPTTELPEAVATESERVINPDPSNENLDADQILEDLAVKNEELAKRKKKRSSKMEAAKLLEQEKRKQREKEQEARYEGVEIDQKLYVGGRLAAQNYEWLTETLGEMIYILNVSESVNYFEEESRFTYKRIKIADACEVDISIFFEEASNFITEGLKNDCCVFVHCREGKSRSIAMIIAHLMIQKNWTLEKAYQHVTNLLPWKENINQGFKLHLMNLDLKRQGIDKVSLDFYDRKNRRRTKPINYCEIDKARQESQKKPKGETI